MNLVTKKTPISKLPKKMGWGQFDSLVCNFFLWQRPQQNLHVLEIWAKTTYEQGGRGLEEHIAQKKDPSPDPVLSPTRLQRSTGRARGEMLMSPCNQKPQQKSETKRGTGISATGRERYVGSLTSILILLCQIPSHEMLLLQITKKAPKS